MSDRSLGRRVWVWLMVALVASVMAVPGARGAVSNGPPTAITTWESDDILNEIELDPFSGRLHVAHEALASHFISVRDVSGNEIRTYGDGILQGRSFGAAFSQDHVFVTDIGSDRVEIFDRVSGAHVGGWGGSGSGRSQFDGPLGISIENAEVYVIDAGNARVQVFSQTGEYLRQFSGAGTTGQLGFPFDLAVYNSELYVADNDRVVVFDPAGNYKRSFGGFASATDSAKQELAEAGITSTGFGSAEALEITDDGDIYIKALVGAGVPSSRFFVFSSAGQLQTSFAGSGQVAVDPGGRSLWTAFSGVEVFSYATCNGLTPTIVGTSFADRVTGTSGDDVVFLDDGNDVVSLADGNDTACGGDGDDTINGGDGRDLLRGDAGRDRLFGGRRPDVLFGGDNGDLLKGQTGSDVLFGERGNDRLIGGNGNDEIDGGRGRVDRLTGRSGTDSCVDRQPTTIRTTCETS